MKLFLFLVPLLMSGCSTAVIVYSRDALSEIRSVAIAPFTSSVKVEKRILQEAENIFTETFKDLGYVVIMPDRFDSLLKNKEFSITGITQDNAAGAGRILAADAVLLGEITIHEEKQVLVIHNRFGMLITGYDDDRTEIRTTYRFKITLKLVRVSDGSVILTMTNRYMEAEHDDYMPGYLTLDTYRELTLKKMGTDLIKTLK